MSFDTEPPTPVRNALLNTEQRIATILTAEIRTPAQTVDYFQRLGAWCAMNLAAIESGGAAAGAGASHG
jgi:hypothetical protein